MGLGFGLICGIGLGIEHIDVQDDEDIKWIITIDILFVRIALIRLK